MNNWDDLLLTGGFAPRDRLLRGLTLEQVSARPHGAAHSIYEELWHAAMCQKLTLDQDRAALARWEQATHFPASAAPESQDAWDELVLMFLNYSERAVRLADDETWLESPGADDPSGTWRNTLEWLAVHSAYHMGKIVLLRELLGLWPRPASEAV